MRPLRSALLSLMVVAGPLVAQQADTVRAEVGSAAIDGRFMKPHAARVRIYRGDSLVQQWLNELQVGDSAGRRVMRWTTTSEPVPLNPNRPLSVLRQTYDARTLAPLGFSSTASTGAFTRVAIDGNRVRGRRRTAGDTTTIPVDITIDRPGYYIGATDLVPIAAGLTAGTVLLAPFWSPTVAAAEYRVFAIHGDTIVRVEGVPVRAVKVDERRRRDGGLVATWYLLRDSPYMVYGEVPLPDGRVQRMTEVEVPLRRDESPASSRELRAADLRIPDVLASVPDDDAKRAFILDCTGCHQMDMARVFPEGQRRSDGAWQVIVQRMLSFAGATTGFPVMGSGRDAVATAAWLGQVYRDAAGIGPHRVIGRAEIDSAMVREYLLEEPSDLPHDVAIDSAGRVVVTGMMTHRMLVLDTATGRWTNIDIPVAQANPRALDVDRAGRWWIALGRPSKVARYSPDNRETPWTVFDAGMYAHSVATAPDGNVWLNGHFTRDPELIARVDSLGRSVAPVSLPAHPTLATDPGGPIPYELRVARDGTVWTSELRGNRLIGFDPATRAQQVIDLPRPLMGPRRFDIDDSGVLWVPAYSGNALLRIDPKRTDAGRIEEYPLPVSNVLPYVARMAPGDSAVWIGTGAGGGLFRFDVRTRRFTLYPLPSPGALVRHLTVHPHTGDVWLAYGASPGIAARIARVTVRRP